MTRRFFTSKERSDLYVLAGGRCRGCGVGLQAGWHADHKTAFALGGRTDLDNGQALCPTCNQRKGTEMFNVRPDVPRAWMLSNRDWAEECFLDYQTKRHQASYTVVATMGAGKTNLALYLAFRELVLLVHFAHLIVRFAYSNVDFAHCYMHPE